MKTRSQYRLERVRIADDDFQIDFDMYVDRDDDDSRHLDGDDWDNVDREHESATQLYDDRHEYNVWPGWTVNFTLRPRPRRRVQADTKVFKSRLGNKENGYSSCCEI